MQTATEITPQISEIQSGREIGFKSKDRKYIWHSCIGCGKQRWVALYKEQPRCLRCMSCGNKASHRPRAGKNCPNWKGGRIKQEQGYIQVWIENTDFYYPMVTSRITRINGGYVFEHRLVMARHLSRLLKPNERVHHLNGIKDDNRIENLELFHSIGAHLTLHNKGYREGYSKGYQDGQGTQIQELKQEIRLLRWQIKRLG